MDSTLVTAMAAIGGSMVGALGTFTGSLITQRYHDRRDLMANQIARRESLYSDFITETARLLVDALETNVVDPKTLIPAYSLLSRMRAQLVADRVGGRRRPPEGNPCHVPQAEPEARANSLGGHQRRRYTEKLQRDMPQRTRVHAKTILTGAARKLARRPASSDGAGKQWHAE
jgi:hypothetical protein